MIVVCEECGIEFDKLPSEIKRTRKNFCSRNCASSHNGRIRTGPYLLKGRDSLYAAARELRASSLSYAAIAKEINVPPSTVRNWVKDIQVDPSSVLRVRANSDSSLVVEKPLSELRTNASVRRRLVRDRGYECEMCGLNEWRGSPIWLEVHHIDGRENTEDNVQLLCLNCHALTDNYRNKNPL